ncbi:MAG: DNA repair protein RadC [Candidatus Izemoplasmatales bacterium]|jgi:DNA repair protein RadC|nr:DNA repair protein RadC [Candidatus Izemoplasmatales bacterium]
MYTIKEMPVLERPRERLERVGAKNISTTELIAILLRAGTKNVSAIEVAKTIIKETNQITELQNKTIQELSSISGVGKTKAITILAAIELGKRVLNPQSEKTKISSANDVYKLLKDELSGLKQEVLVVLFLDLKTNLIAKKQIFMGSLNQSLIHPREVYKYAVKFSAFQIILVHNHPSGDPEPSFQDIEVTKRFIEAGDMLQIKVADHIVIGSNGYVSVMDYLKK